MPDDRSGLLQIKPFVVSTFTAENWIELGIFTNCTDIVQNHPRLLRALSWNDPDYPGACLAVMSSMLDRDYNNSQRIEAYLVETFSRSEEEINISSLSSSGPTIVFKPNVFELPTGPVEQDLLSVMMPFSSNHQEIFDNIVLALRPMSVRC